MWRFPPLAPWGWGACAASCSADPRSVSRSGDLEGDPGRNARGEHEHAVRARSKQTHQSRGADKQPQGDRDPKGVGLGLERNPHHQSGDNLGRWPSARRPLVLTGLRSPRAASRRRQHHNRAAGSLYLEEARSPAPVLVPVDLARPRSGRAWVSRHRSVHRSGGWFVRPLPRDERSSPRTMTTRSLRTSCMRPPARDRSACRSWIRGEGAAAHSPPLSMPRGSRRIARRPSHRARSSRPVIARGGAPLRYGVVPIPMELAPAAARSRGAERSAPRRLASTTGLAGGNVILSGRRGRVRGRAHGHR